MIRHLGGIKATFLTDYVHTLVVMTILFLFGFTAYATSDLLGSPGAVWDALTAVWYSGVLMLQSLY